MAEPIDETQKSLAAPGQAVSSPPPIVRGIKKFVASIPDQPTGNLVNPAAPAALTGKTGYAPTPSAVPSTPQGSAGLRAAEAKAGIPPAEDVTPETVPGMVAPVAKAAGDTMEAETQQTVKDYLAERFGLGDMVGAGVGTPSFTNIPGNVGEGDYLVGDPGQEAAGAAMSLAGQPGEFGPSPAGPAPGLSTIQPPADGGYVAPITGHGFTSDANADYQGWIASVGGGDFAKGMEALRAPTHTRRGGSISDYRIKDETRLSDSEIFASYMNARTQALGGDVDFATALNNNIQTARDQSESRAIEKAGQDEDKRKAGVEEQGTTYDRIADLVTNATDAELGLKEGATETARMEGATKRVLDSERTIRESHAGGPDKGGKDGWQDDGTYLRDNKRYKPSKNKEGKWNLGKELERIESDK